jgi:hypothetical protein
LDPVFRFCSIPSICIDGGEKRGAGIRPHRKIAAIDGDALGLPVNDALPKDRD